MAGPGLRLDMELVPSPSLIERLLALAQSRGVDAQRLLDEAVRQFVEGAAISDVSASEVAESQAAMLSELDLGEWNERSGA